ncbi:MAG: response regulator [Gammaproteobacteria bacterium]|nr:response regulator [Gammaproteobacteria bacterium]
MVKFPDNYVAIDSVDCVRILIVDDEVDISDSLSVILEMHDERYTIKTASGLKQARSLVDEFKPDIALLDIKLGQDSGLDLLSWLKQEFEGVYCIMMTAFRETKYAVTAVKHGADDYLHKPVDAEQLLVAVTRATEIVDLNRQRIQTEKRFRAVFEQTFQWLLLADSNGVLLEANQVALDFRNLESTHVLGAALEDAPWWAGSPVTKEKLNQMLPSVSAGSFMRDEIQIKNSANKMITFDMSIKPINNHDGNIEMMLIECRDISDRKQAEMLVKKAHDDLEFKVAERTEELQAAMLRAETANRAKSDFLSRMSHELRTPMNAILGFSQLIQLQLEASSVKTDIKPDIDEIVMAGEHLLALINEVLDLAKIEGGNLKVDLEPVELECLMDECLVMIAPLAVSKNIEVVNYLSNADYTVIANHLRLKQVMINLLSNSVKYNKENGSVTVSSVVTDSKIKIIVKDTGIGLRPEQIEKLFRPFERVHDDPAIEGTGIGLVISKTLTNLMDGEIGVCSVYGQGSEFWIVLNLSAK